MGKESYTAWLRHRTDCSDKALQAIGLTQKSKPIDKVLRRARVQRHRMAAYRAYQPCHRLPEITLGRWGNL